MKPFANQGAALITALFIMAIVVIIATSLIGRLHIDIERSDLLITSDKCYLAAQRVKYWAMGLLAEKIVILSQPFDPIQEGDLIVQGEIVDAQGLFNLNNMYDKIDIDPVDIIKVKTSKRHFMVLLKTLIPTMENVEAEQLVNALTYWLSHTVTDQNIEESYLKTGYRVSHLAMSSPSELRLIQGFSASIYNALAPFIIVLPKHTPVNINSASVPVLMSIGNGLSKEQAEQIIQIRNNLQGFKSLAEFNENEDIKKMNILEKDITVTSQYFLVRAHVVKNKQELTVYYLLERVEKDSVPQINIVWQRFNVL